MAEIEIGGNSYFSYATVDDADKYLVVIPGSESWFLLDIEGKGRNLVAASTYLDTLPWSEACGTQEIRETKIGVINATILLANMIANGDTDFLGLETSGQDVKRLKAGSVEVENFAKFPSGLGGDKPLSATLPSFVYSQIKGCLAVTNMMTFTGSKSWGTSETSTVKEPWDFSS